MFPLLSFTHLHNCCVRGEGLSPVDAKVTRVGTFSALAPIGRRSLAPVNVYFLARQEKAICPAARNNAAQASPAHTSAGADTLLGNEVLSRGHAAWRRGLSRKTPDAYGVRTRGQGALPITARRNPRRRIVKEENKP